jgi:hypothetical protein
MFEKLSKILLLSVFLLGCAPRRVLQSNIADSLKIQVNTREIYLLDSVGFRVPLQRETQTIEADSSYLATDFAWSVAMWRNGKLTHSIANIPGVWYTPYWRRETRKDSIVYRNFYRDIVTKVPRELTNWQKWQMRGFWILLLVGILIVCRKIIRNF